MKIIYNIPLVLVLTVVFCASFVPSTTAGGHLRPAGKSGEPMAYLSCNEKRFSLEKLQEYNFDDGAVYIVVFDSKDPLLGAVDAFKAKFGFEPRRVMKNIGMFSGPFNQEHIEYILTIPHVKYVECDNVVHMMRKDKRDL